jgi:hypothetical protein
MYHAESAPHILVLNICKFVIFIFPPSFKLCVPQHVLSPLKDDTDSVQLHCNVAFVRVTVQRYYS